MLRTLLVVVCITVVAGCIPTVRVTKNPGDCDKGVRYYRPKPYLMVTAAGQTQTTGGTTTVTPTDQYVNLDIKYLPDFSEEYTINVNPGLGVANVTISLQDGWNLTSINQNLDSKFADNLNAVANVLGKVAPGGLVKTSDEGPPGLKERISVAARNVPLGLYESVIGVDQCGKKQLYGWRYVGFAPFNACPLYPTGAESACCNDGTLDLYGLVFENGVMLFKPLLKVRDISTTEASKRLEIVGVTGTAASDNPRALAPDQQTAVLKSKLKMQFPDTVVDVVTFKASDVTLLVELSPTHDKPETRQSIKVAIQKFMKDNGSPTDPTVLFHTCPLEE